MCTHATGGGMCQKFLNFRFDYANTEQMMCLKGLFAAADRSHEWTTMFQRAATEFLRQHCLHFPFFFFFFLLCPLLPQASNLPQSVSSYFEGRPEQSWTVTSPLSFHMICQLYVPRFGVKLLLTQMLWKFVSGVNQKFGLLACKWKRGYIHPCISIRKGQKRWRWEERRDCLAAILAVCLAKLGQEKI